MVREAGWLYGQRAWQTLNPRTGEFDGPRFISRHDAIWFYKRREAACGS